MILKNLFIYLNRAEKIVCYGSLSVLALLPCLESFMRLVFKTGVPSSPDLIVHFLLLLGLFSGMMTTKTGNHLCISVVQYIKNEKIKKVCKVASASISTFITVILAFCSAAFIKIVVMPSRMIGFIPDVVFCLAMPLAYIIMAIRFSTSDSLTPKQRTFPKIALVIGLLFSLPMVVKIIWGFNLPGIGNLITNVFYYLAFNIKYLALLFLFVAALTGTPLFIFIAGLSILLFQSSPGGQIDVTANQIYTALTQSSFVAIPLFTLAGFFLSESKAGERLVDAFRSLFSFIPGGMIYASVIICAFFTSFTGASGITILALGGLLYAILCTNSGYPSKFSVGLLASCGSIGLMFPPSLPIIMVGTTLQTDIRKMFAAGIVPGLILVLSMAVFGIVVSIKTKIPTEKLNLRNCAVAIKHSFLELLLPVLLIGGYFSGRLQLTELGAFAVLYTFVVEVLIFRDIKLRDLSKLFGKAIPIIGGILSILALSQALSYYLVDTQLPQNFARWMQHTIQSKWVFLLILNLALLAIGCLMDIFSAIVIVLPLLIPFTAVYGIDPIHLGIIFLINMEAGFLTPPIGLNLFLASYRFNKPFVEICRCVLPFLIVQLAVIFIITYIPSISTFVVNLF
ncbi:MAG: TRAP transporter large permease subunit [Termitinemataceae bacterium]|nr:MAG: TRAP transporter large permease subunit [Termitinemataceae bacterium]